MMDEKILLNRISEVLEKSGSSFPKVFGNAVIEYLQIPMALRPIIPRGKKLELSEEYFITDSVREKINGRGYRLPTGSIREFRILYQYKDMIAEEIPETSKRQKTKKSAIKNLDYLDWTKWYCGEAIPKGPAFGAEFDFVFELEYPLDVEANTMSKKIGLSNVEKLTRMRFITEFTSMDYHVSPPVLELYGKSADSTYEDYTLVAKPDRHSFERSQLNMAIELSPMAPVMIKALDQLISDMKRYKKEFYQTIYSIGKMKERLR